ncbi:hypothetical protein [Pedobacter sp. B4-66]|uniref:hypothetical protein n=1 Tax=Pedobacter sp. B4-66 TaxID=2817280 RepID=UPI001BDA3C53|nr:hypothetical protein [Pedobacter sp. B4-66]
MKKRLSYIAFCIILTIASCKKKDSGIKPEEIPTALDRININDQFEAFLEYDKKDRLVRYSRGSEEEYFEYNDKNEVVKVTEINSFTSPSSNSSVTKIFYKNGLPFSGSRICNPPYSKSPNHEYYVDSVSYKVVNNEVTVIKYFDRKYYNYYTRELTRSSTDTLGIHLFSYANKNLVSETLSRDNTLKYTYGSKKGILSAKKLPFVLYGSALPVLYGENELLTTEDKVETRTYNYTYNQADIPVSAKVVVTYKADYAPTSYNQSFIYK